MILILLVFAFAFAGCDSAPTSWRPPLSPSLPPQAGPPPATTLRVFTDVGSGFSTTDVRDAEEQIVQFNSAGELIWTADGTRLPGYFVQQGIFIPADQSCRCWFEVRFGSADGQRRAYLTADYGHDNPGTVVDLEVVGGALVCSRTDVYPAGTYTLSGVVTELTPAGPIPLEGAAVYFPLGSGYRGATTDTLGFYAVPGLYNGNESIYARKEGYGTQTTAVSIHGNTRFDVQLVRQ